MLKKDPVERGTSNSVYKYLEVKTQFANSLLISCFIIRLILLLFKNAIQSDSNEDIIWSTL